MHHAIGRRWLIDVVDSQSRTPVLSSTMRASAVFAKFRCRDIHAQPVFEHYAIGRWLDQSNATRQKIDQQTVAITSPASGNVYLPSICRQPVAVIKPSADETDKLSAGVSCVAHPIAASYTDTAPKADGILAHPRGCNHRSTRSSTISRAGKKLTPGQPLTAASHSCHRYGTQVNHHRHDHQCAQYQSVPHDERVSIGAQFLGGRFRQACHAPPNCLA